MTRWTVGAYLMLHPHLYRIHTVTDRWVAYCRVLRVGEPASAPRTNSRRVLRQHDSAGEFIRLGYPQYHTVRPPDQMLARYGRISGTEIRLIEFDGCFRY